MVRRWCYSLLIFGLIGPGLAVMIVPRWFASTIQETHPRSSNSPSENDHLGLASHYLENGDRTKACRHFRLYLRKYPMQWDIRAFYAEVLLKDGRLNEAVTELRRYLADAQADRLALPRQLFQGHQRLLEIAEHRNDEYQIHLQRGLALYWLARARRDLGDINGTFSVEGVLAKAGQEMMQAHRHDPNQARPCWYASQIWRKLGRTQLYHSWLFKAKRLSATSHLTPYEQMQLSISLQESRLSRRR